MKIKTSRSLRPTINFQLIRKKVINYPSIYPAYVGVKLTIYRGLSTNSYGFTEKGRRRNSSGP
jgi:phage gp37-like protein